MKRLSLAYIVRDEIKNLPESIEMMRDLADEIVVVDTGSRDGTWQWAQSKDEITLKRIKWKDDYAEARNLSLGLCTCPWILVIDADEWIDKRYFSAIRKTVENFTAHDGFLMTIHNFITSPFWDSKSQPMYGKAVRLFRNSNAIRYEGCVHNQLVGIKSKGELNIAVYHFQYRERFIYKEKAKKNFALLQKRIAKEGENFHLCVWHGDIYRRLWLWYQELENLKSAIHWFKKALTYSANEPAKISVISKTLKQCEEILNVYDSQNNKVQKVRQQVLAG